MADSDKANTEQVEIDFSKMTDRQLFETSCRQNAALITAYNNMASRIDSLTAILAQDMKESSDILKTVLKALEKCDDCKFGDMELPPAEAPNAASAEKFGNNLTPQSSENDLLFAAAKGVLSSRYGDALAEFGGDAHLLEEHRISLCQQEDMKFCTNDCKGRHDCRGHAFCDYCGKPMCGCDVGYIGLFAVCTPCREKIKGAFAPNGDCNIKKGKGNG